MSSSSTGLEIESLPYIDIQHDALAVFDDVEQSVVLNEDIWISGYKAGSSSIHGKAKVGIQDGGGVGVRGREGVKIERVSRTQFSVSIPELNLENVPVKFPKQIIHPNYKKAKPTSAPLHINCIDYSPLSQQLVVGGPDGYCSVIPVGVTTGSERQRVELELKGHVGDVLSTKWFPSGEVVLTSSSDLSLRIFSSKNGINPRTLEGHTRAITCTHILGVGKEVLSGSKDGTVRLWNVGEGKEIRKWELEGRTAVESMVVLNDLSSLAALDLEGEESVIILGSKEGIFVQPWSSGSKGWFCPNDGKVGGLVSLAISSDLKIVVSGHTDGIVHLRSLAKLKRPNTDTNTPTGTTSSQVIEQVGSMEKLIRRNESPIYSLKFDSSDLLVGTAAGLPCRLSISLSESGSEPAAERGRIDVRLKEEHAGWEAVGVECWAVVDSSEVSSKSIWCAGGEGGIRRY